MTLTVRELDSTQGQVPDGTLQFAEVGEYTFETGGYLPNVKLAFETWGELNADASNAVLLLHALTGDTHVARGESKDAGWWDQLVGPGGIVDTNHYFVVAPNMIGSCYGSTGPASIAPDGRPWGSRFPFTTIRDSVNLELRLADQLGIDKFHAVLGGSMGGARALEWGVSAPERVGHCVVVAACAKSTAEQIAFAQAQTAAIRLDPNYRGGDYYDAASSPAAGLGIARRIAHVTYRSEAELESRFSRQSQGEEDPFGGETIAHKRGRYAVESYLDHQAGKIVDRFDANSYIVLTEALMSHDVGRSRGGVAEALASAEDVEFLVAAVNSDRLYWPAQSDEIVNLVARGKGVYTIDSPIGHDGFLTDIHQLGPVLNEHVFTSGGTQQARGDQEGR